VIKNFRLIEQNEAFSLLQRTMMRKKSSKLSIDGDIADAHFTSQKLSPDANATDYQRHRSKEQTANGRFMRQQRLMITK